VTRNYCIPCSCGPAAVAESLVGTNSRPGTNSVPAVGQRGPRHTLAVSSTLPPGKLLSTCVRRHRP